MLLHVDPSDARPLHEQLAAELRRAIRTRDLAAGDRLPTAKELGDALGLNANTVLRALRALRDEGLLEFRRGRGVRVSALSPGDAEVAELVRRLVEVGERNGYRREELAHMIEEFG
ncbi:GntR family transcriptional regulator [Streptomyces radicis]|uniref:GntR family transcriptional regulator n=2 Tax=Streptomyces radicis TaxID=1750517 RepID=A0A3A9VVM9_9ACTN|nr:GntR family transcriptional regulator [Streptomyces radicis]RKN05061.1 GntR family transcriptional regulator [Streptomyces radicis]RKN16387.1 GntR family transcriptional regulator [Streptomyces radicis]